jgi:hypothetical protein
MTLKQKFLPFVDYIDLINDIPNEEWALRNADKCVEVADEYAIAFTDWCEDYYYPSSTKGIWFDKPDFDSANRYTTGELLKIYKK